MSFSDIEYDFGVSRGLKGKPGDEQIWRLNDFRASVEFLRTLSSSDVEEADDDYLFFLRDLSRCRARLNDNVDNGSDSEADSGYKQFLEGLRVDGGSCILEIPAGDGPSDLVEYEEKHKEEERRHLGNSDFESSQTVKGRKKRESTKSREALSSRTEACQLSTDAPRSSSDADATARKERYESRRIKKILYESQRIRKSLSEGKEKRTGRSLKGIKRGRKINPVVDSEARAPLSCEPSGSLGETHSLEPRPDPEQDQDVEYQFFLGCLEHCGHVMVLKPNDHEEFLYDKDESPSDDSDSEVMIVDDTPFLDGRLNPFVSSKAYLWSVDESMDDEKSADQSQFRVNLMKCIEQPYDAEDYADLLEKINFKKPIERHRENRSGEVKSCILANQPGLSYLEHYGEFAMKFESVQDKHKKLQLLRAFFFWLENAGHDDQFRPWRDPLFMKTIL